MIILFKNELRDKIPKKTYLGLHGNEFMIIFFISRILFFGRKWQLVDLIKNDMTVGDPTSF